MNIQKLTLFLLASLLLSFTPKEKIPFEGYAALENCIEKIPLYYATKKKGPLLEAAERLKEVEIVLVTTHKKEKPSYAYYYLVITESIDGNTAYLEPSASHNKETSQRNAIFLGYKEKKHFFYTAECFNKILAENPTLKESLRKE